VTEVAIEARGSKFVIVHRMSQPCKSWSTGDRATPVPVLEGWQCAGCRWLPRADVLRFAQITTDPQLMRELTELAGVVECWCERCDKEQASPNEISLFLRFRMNLCPICGYKRCPRATDHRNECTGSNEPGQPGSSYPELTELAG
jgi:hypothetical protein